MILEVQHETTFSYAQPVREWLCELRMEPASDRGQRCHSFRISTGLAHPLATYRDGFGNVVHHFNLLAPPPRVRDAFFARVLLERKLGAKWTVYAEYTWERNRCNDPLAAYSLNEGLLGIRWNWEK